MDPQALNPASPPGRVEEAELCLRGASHAALRNLSCEYWNGVLVLRGCVPTYYLKQVAQAAVSRLEGVERIDNQIKVVAPAVLPRRG